MIDDITLSAELGALIGGARLPAPDRDDSDCPPPSEDTFHLNEGQADAVDRIAAWRRDPIASRFMSLTGPAGTGKTTVLQTVRARLFGTRTAWAAMTGKAASRMREASGVNAKTLHSVLYDPPREIDNPERKRTELDFDTIKTNADTRSCLLVIDEASMISAKVRADITRSGYDKVLFVGDPYQIPPVISKQEEQDGQANFSVFANLEESANLSEVMRAGGAVLTAATHVRKRQEILEESLESGGSRYDYMSAANHDAAAQIAIGQWLADPEDHVLITWRNEVRNTVSRLVRKRLGRASELPEPGEPMVVRRNVYGTGLSNGDMVKIEEWLSEGPTICDIETRWVRVRSTEIGSVVLLAPSKHFDGNMPYVPFDKWKKAIDRADVDSPTPLTWGYCLTAHLVQGSEFRRATTFLLGEFDNANFTKMTTLPGGMRMSFAMRFLYTTIARAKQHAGVVIS